MGVCTMGLKQKGASVRRFCFLFVVLIPLSWFTAGCGRPAPSSGPPLSKDDMQKMAEAQRKESTPAGAQGSSPAGGKR